MALNAPPIRAAIVDSMGNASIPWSKWFQEVYARIGASLGRSTTAIDADVSSITDVAPRVSSLETSRTNDEARITALESAAPNAFPSYTVATVPNAFGHAGKTVFVSNESGGAVLAFSDGTAWRRVTDRAVIS